MVQNKPILSRGLFYTLSWTWGFIMTIIGALVVGCIKIYGLFAKKTFKLKKHGYCYYLNIGKSWGGIELGMFFLTDSRDSNATKWHEHGHGIQNCFWGPLMPFVICIPSATRYWYREFKYNRKGLNPPTTYDSIWFEKDATMTGRKYRKYFAEVVSR